MHISEFMNVLSNEQVNMLLKTECLIVNNNDEPNHYYVSGSTEGFTDNNGIAEGVVAVTYSTATQEITAHVISGRGIVAK